MSEPAQSTEHVREQIFDYVSVDRAMLDLAGTPLSGPDKLAAAEAIQISRVQELADFTLGVLSGHRESTEASLTSLQQQRAELDDSIASASDDLSLINAAVRRSVHAQEGLGPRMEKYKFMQWIETEGPQTFSVTMQPRKESQGRGYQSVSASLQPWIMENRDRILHRYGDDKAFFGAAGVLERYMDAIQYTESSAIRAEDDGSCQLVVYSPPDFFRRLVIHGTNFGTRRAQALLAIAEMQAEDVAALDEQIA